MSLPPAQPVYILRGHASQIHSTTFIRANTRLITGDADGWVVIWSLEMKRPVAVWRAHESVILGSAAWGPERLITHGKDNKLIVWKLRQEDESSMSTSLPVDGTTSVRRRPWLLHILEVNTLNFCSLSHCKVQGKLKDMEMNSIVGSGAVEELLIAVPNTITSEAVDIFHLPSERRIYTVPGDASTKTGMVMAVAVFYQGQCLTIAVGYESGHVTVTQQVDGQGWQILYMSKPHSQPVLSLDIAPSRLFFITSSADAIIAKHPIPTIPLPTTPFPNPSPPAAPGGESPKPASSRDSLLSQGLVSAGASKDRGISAAPKIEVQTKPLKTLQTKHSGQQGLRIRSDGMILATAGWDCRVRVYSAQSLKELAVLKWHKEGCYTVAFADLLSPEELECEHERRGQGAGSKPVDAVEQAGRTTDLVASSHMTELIRKQRALKAMTTHWLAAGSKDGKISLWEIY